MTIGQRANIWRQRQRYSMDPIAITAKLLEEAGEVAKAVIGIFEQREGRGDPVQEAAQTVIVLCSLIDRVAPGVDLIAEVEKELNRIGAPSVHPCFAQNETCVCLQYKDHDGPHICGGSFCEKTWEANDV